MPLALVAAAIASLGLHALALFVPEFERSPPPEPLPLQAEIVLKPRAAPAKQVAPRAKPAPRAVAPVAPAVAPTPEPAPAAAEAPSAEAGALPEAAEPAAAAEPAETAEPPPAELALPPAGEIRFTVLRGDPPAIVGRATLSWALRDGSYRLLNVSETVGLVALFKPITLETESRGRVVADGLRPERYTSRRSDKSTDERVDFDWAAGVARFSRGRETPLPAGAQDLLSFNFQLGWLARTGDMAIATARKLGHYRLQLVGEELLETPVGSLRTLHFRAPGEATTEVWLAPERHLLPVKIRYIDKKGMSYDQLVEEIRIPPP